MSSSHMPVPLAPSLVLHPDGITEEGHTILLDSKGECIARNIEALGSNMIFSLTWQGWILSLNRDDFRTMLCNPHTLEKIELPRLVAHQLPRDFECALSDKPTSVGCVVVALHPDDTCFWYCHIGGHEWIKYDYDVGSQQYDVKGLVWKKIIIDHLTPCKGKFYFPISYLKHGVLEFDPSPKTHIMTLQGLPTVVPPNPYGYRAHTCNFELDNEPCRFFAYFYEDRKVVTSIALYKMDVARQQWYEVDEIGDRALLWSGYRGGCCSATRFGLEPNCVYWISQDDSSMHIFNIVENTERVCYHPSEDLPRLSSEAFWLLPSNSTIN
ncbi:unnamed protein product [Urochloa decumbens]|uniref:KIB1-4 beta-propeller domain-containing protein n=1 Tax=Urochloa decumbens TaxID=240449 RepID=A0ABC8XPQ5_9POAL